MTCAECGEEINDNPKVLVIFNIPGRGELWTYPCNNCDLLHRGDSGLPLVDPQNEFEIYLVNGRTVYANGQAANLRNTEF